MKPPVDDTPRMRWSGGYDVPPPHFYACVPTAEGVFYDAGVFDAGFARARYSQTSIARLACVYSEVLYLGPLLRDLRSLCRASTLPTEAMLDTVLLAWKHERAFVEREHAAHGRALVLALLHPEWRHSVSALAGVYDLGGLSAARALIASTRTAASGGAPR